MVLQNLIFNHSIYGFWWFLSNRNPSTNNDPLQTIDFTLDVASGPCIEVGRHGGSARCDAAERNAYSLLTRRSREFRRYIFGLMRVLGPWCVKMGVQRKQVASNMLKLSHHSHFLWTVNSTLPVRSWTQAVQRHPSTTGNSRICAQRSNHGKCVRW